MGRRIPYPTRKLWADKEAWAEVYVEYMEAEDPTEYYFATNSKHILNWEHWTFVLSSPYCRKDVDKWRSELAVKLRAQAVRSMIGLVNSEKPSFQAAKFLVDRGWVTETEDLPSKSAVSGEDAQIADDIEDLFAISQGRAQSH